MASAGDSSERYQRGVEMIRDVYAGDVIDLPEHTIPFNDVMMRTLFAEVWARTDLLDIRSRRLLIMGVIAANGHLDTWKIQARAALKRGELTPAELRETLVMLAPYAGYPNLAGFAGGCEEVIGKWEAEGRPRHGGT